MSATGDLQAVALTGNRDMAEDLERVACATCERSFAPSVHVRHVKVGACVGSGWAWFGSRVCRCPCCTHGAGHRRTRNTTPCDGAVRWSAGPCGPRHEGLCARRRGTTSATRAAPPNAAEPCAIPADGADTRARTPCRCTLSLALCRFPAHAHSPLSAPARLSVSLRVSTSLGPRAMPRSALRTRPAHSPARRPRRPSKRASETTPPSLGAARGRELGAGTNGSGTPRVGGANT